MIVLILALTLFQISEQNLSQDRILSLFVEYWPETWHTNFAFRFNQFSNFMSSNIFISPITEGSDLTALQKFASFCIILFLSLRESVFKTPLFSQLTTTVFHEKVFLQYIFGSQIIEVVPLTRRFTLCVTCLHRLHLIFSHFLCPPPSYSFYVIFYGNNLPLDYSESKLLE